MTYSGLVTPHSRPTTPSFGLNSNAATSATSTGPSNSSSGSTPKVIVPSYEKPIHESLSQIYKTLLELKNNRSKYINSKQIYKIYHEFLDILNELKVTRKDEELKGITLNLPNTNDLITDDIFQLLSLCFVTCGLTKFAPATYSSLSTVMKLLNHLKECKVYTVEDLAPIGIRLAEIRDIVISTTNYEEDDDEDEEEEANRHANHQIEETLLRNKLIKCETLYQDLESNFKNVPKDLEPTYNKLIELRKNILNYMISYKDEKSNAGKNLIKHEKLTIKINQFKAELKKIEQYRDETDMKFHSNDVSDLDEQKLESLQAIMNGLIDECNNLLGDLLAQDDSDEISSSLSSLNLNEESQELKAKYDSIYHQLQDLKLTLENLLITRRWTLRETDLYSYQKQLKTFDEQRLNLVKQTNKDDTKAFKKSQLLILFLLRRCYGLVYKLLESSEPVSESLTPIHNQLQTVKRCLLELKHVDGLNNLKELYPFQFKLASLDNLRQDGKFIVDGSIPEGQGTLNALLAECFDIVQELKIELEEKEIENGDEGEDDLTGGSFTNSKTIGNGNNELTDDDVEIKRNRFHDFNEADYDLDSESDYDDDDDDDNDYSISESEYEGNDYY
ncbi:hypothetical protein MG7_00946 [Candida albicans P34048]|nr:hypothetical protein MG7_00946 [Candida albicans P34048]